MNSERPMVRINQAVLCPNVLTWMFKSAAMTRKPGDSMGPNAPTTAATKPTMRSIASFLHVGQFNGSFGESEG